MTGKKASRQHEHDRKYGNAGWYPCRACQAYGEINGVKCFPCNGIGFIRRSA